MNRVRHLLLLALLGLITACSLNELPENLSLLPIEEDGLVLKVETRAETYKGQSLDQEHFVTAEDLENFVKYRRSASKRSDLTGREVKSYGFDTSQTLFYILNYDQGWEVVSADKRVQPTLAHGDSGEFTMDCDNEAMKFWMNMLADGVLQMRLGNVEKKSEEATASTESKDASAESTSDHTAFWDAISPTHNSPTRFEPLTPTPGPVEQDFYLYVVDKEESVQTTAYGPYLQTKWAQGAPWNKYCPLETNGSGEKSPAGCTAVAGAQLLYYLAQSLDYDIYAPRIATCEGNINGFNREFLDFTYDAWDYMAIEFYDPEANRSTSASAALIAYVGSLCNMDYGNDSSDASPGDLMDSIEELYGISSTMSDLWSYSSDVIIENLMNELPVFIWGAETIFGGGHSWLIEGYEITTTITTTYYKKSTIPLLEWYVNTLDRDDADHSITNWYTTKTFHMNWGWGGVYDGEYSLLPENWSVSGEDGLITYDVVMRMYYEFSQDN